MLDPFRKYFLPYCVDRQPDGRYALLNRRHKPIGLHLRTHVEYGDFPCLFRIPSLDADKAAALSWEGSPDVARIYLHDGENPLADPVAWQAYCGRLLLLGQLLVEA